MDTSRLGDFTPMVLRSGEFGALIDCLNAQQALRVLSVLRSAAERGDIAFDELVPGAQTVLVVGGEVHDLAAFASKLSALLRAGSAGRLADAAASEITIPVVYDGADLAEVARLCALSTPEVVARHTAATYQVAFTGFAPGFAYLSGGDPRISVPRHATPRTRIPGGSVALAGDFSGIYPRESPGGWQIIGHTDAVLWDSGRTPPALLTPGSTVRFSAHVERIELTQAQISVTQPSTDQEAAQASTDERSVPRVSTSAAAEMTEPVPAAPMLTVVNPGLLTLIQDDGRPGFASMGVSRSGAADRAALHEANRCVENPPGAAALEISLGVFSADIHEATTLAFTGAERVAKVTGPSGERLLSPGEAFAVEPGDRLEFGHPVRGVRTIIALRGGVRSDTELGSASRDTLARLGPPPLTAGSDVSSAELDPVGAPLADSALTDQAQTASLPAPGEVTVIRVLVGPRESWVSDESLETFFAATWEVSMQSDRIGVRLAGPALMYAEAHRTHDLPSEGLVTGAIQVPPSGHPIVFLADHPVSGGYPVIGVVAEDSLSLAAQLPPGALVRFEGIPSDTRNASGPRSTHTAEWA